MFIEDIKSFILNNKKIVAITNRGLEDCNRHVVFIATNLLERYPELVEVIKERDKTEAEDIKIEIVEEIVEDKPKTKRKTKKTK